MNDDFPDSSLLDPADAVTVIVEQGKQIVGAARWPIPTTPRLDFRRSSCSMSRGSQARLRWPKKASYSTELSDFEFGQFPAQHVDLSMSPQFNRIAGEIAARATRRLIQSEPATRY